MHRPRLFRRMGPLTILGGEAEPPCLKLYHTERGLRRLVAQTGENPRDLTDLSPGAQMRLCTLVLDRVFALSKDLPSTSYTVEQVADLRYDSRGFGDGKNVPVEEALGVTREMFTPSQDHPVSIELHRLSLRGLWLVQRGVCGTGDCRLIEGQTSAAPVIATYQLPPSRGE